MPKFKILLQIFVLALFLGIISMPGVLYGAENPVCRSQNGGHCINFAATAVPGLEFLGNEPSDPGELISSLYKFGLGLVGISAFIMFIIGGVQYMVAVDKDPTEAKSRMKNAVIGLTMALLSYLILFTINPDLVKPLDTSSIKKLDIKSQSKDAPTGDFKSCIADGGIPIENICITKTELETQRIGSLCGMTFGLICESDASLCRKAGGETITVAGDLYCSKPFK